MLTLEVKLKVMINYELEREILSYADSVLVIAPASLAEAIRSRLANALKAY
jgi:predicted DNA-binding transcriptional regulator YafY